LISCADFISDHLREELDFVNEARNGERTAALIAGDRALAGRVHVPRIHPYLSSRRVLTTEWIDGVRLSSREAIMLLMGDTDRLPRASQADFADAPSVGVGASTEALQSVLPGYDGRPLKGGVRGVMQTMVELFGAQIFRWGWVHADPHPGRARVTCSALLCDLRLLCEPGNFLLRPHPDRPREPQLVLLDHGLYVHLRPDFQRQYAELWKGLMTGDGGVVRGIASEWGIGAPDVFASATLLRPMRLSRAQARAPGGRRLSQYEISVRMKARLRSFLRDTDKMPKELVFIGRNMRMLQGNNQM
jgi:aarF domain-containing kinase